MCKIKVWFLSTTESVSHLYWNKITSSHFIHISSIIQSSALSLIAENQELHHWKKLNAVISGCSLSSIFSLQVLTSVKGFIMDSIKGHWTISRSPSTSIRLRQSETEKVQSDRRKQDEVPHPADHPAATTSFSVETNYGVFLSPHVGTDDSPPEKESPRWILQTPKGFCPAGWTWTRRTSSDSLPEAGIRGWPMVDCQRLTITIVWSRKRLINQLISPHRHENKNIQHCLKWTVFDFMKNWITVELNTKLKVINT